MEGEIESAFFERAINEFRKREPNLSDLDIFQYASISKFQTGYERNALFLRDYIVSLDHDERKRWLIRLEECTGVLTFRSKAVFAQTCFYRDMA